MIDMTIDARRFMPNIQAIEDRIAKKIAAAAKNIVYFIDASVHAKTPVHTGEAVRNMIWSMDMPSPASFPAIDNGPPGVTSQMALGAEPRRPPNAAAAKQTLRALTFVDPFHVYILHNESSDIGLIEYGGSGNPKYPRAPNGVFAVTMAEVAARLQAGSL